MKGISPMIATVLIIAFTIAIGGIISVFMTNLTKTTTGEAEKGAAGVSECASAYINILAVNGTGSTSSVIISNPSSNKIYITGFTDNLANVSEIPEGNKILISGNTTSLAPVKIGSTATKIMIVGLCENSVRTSNFSISGTCPKGGSCWPS